jgi:hypothetical protein
MGGDPDTQAVSKWLRRIIAVTERTRCAQLNEISALVPNDTSAGAAKVDGTKDGQVLARILKEYGAVPGKFIETDGERGRRGLELECVISSEIIGHGGNYTENFYEGCFVPREHVYASDRYLTAQLRYGAKYGANPGALAGRSLPWSRGVGRFDGIAVAQCLTLLKMARQRIRIVHCWRHSGRAYVGPEPFCVQANGPRHPCKPGRLDARTWRHFRAGT